MQLSKQQRGDEQRQAGFYRNLRLWSRDGHHKFTLDLTWLGQEQEAERKEGRGSLAHYYSAIPTPSQAEAVLALLP